MAGRGARQAARQAARRAVVAGALVAGAALLWLASSPLRDRARRTERAAANQGAAGASNETAESAHARASRAGSGSPPAATPEPETSDELRARLAGQALEARTRNAARHAELSTRWASERRDEPWSTDQEHALRAAASSAAIDHLVIELECRRTLCRVELSAADSDTAFALQRARGFTALLGTDTGSAMHGGGPDRAMEVFAARDGMGSPKGP